MKELISCEWSCSTVSKWFSIKLGLTLNPCAHVILGTPHEEVPDTPILLRNQFMKIYLCVDFDRIFLCPILSSTAINMGFLTLTILYSTLGHYWPTTPLGMLGGMLSWHPIQIDMSPSLYLRSKISWAF